MSTFTPNQGGHVFEEEMLTPEEQYAAVPDRPDFSSVQRIHKDIINPEEVADLFTTLNANDVLVTSLSNCQQLYGDRTFPIASKLRESVEPPVFPYASILRPWQAIYNKQVKTLTDLEPATQSPNPPPAKSRQEALFEKGDLTLDQFFKQTRAINNSQNLLNKGTRLSSTESVFTVEQASAIVLRNAKNASDLVEFLQFITPTIGLFFPRGLERMLVQACDSCEKLGSGSFAIADLVRAIERANPRLVSNMSPRTLDSISFCAADADNDLSVSLLKKMVTKGYCPEDRTLDKVAANYRQSSPVQTKKDLYFLKSVIFHREPTFKLFQLLLSSIGNINELNKYITLLSKRYPDTLALYQLDLFQKMMELSSERNLWQAQFLKVLKQSNVKLSKPLAETILSSANVDLNAKEALKTLM
ncbi:uncharacterized protein LODBEIA_P43070 [Lodderomyces beijingensis]|uniref:Uncharacterized protein n=1 Tax=Lodderomyces beijingensis TaxID=1775926 RepID=A0ABP0ZQY1_9ASCO